MVTVTFTQNLQRHVSCPQCEVPAGTLRSVLEAVFADHPRLRNYILDDQGELRRHMNVFVNDTPIRDRATLAEPVTDGARVYVIQALSGG